MWDALTDAQKAASWWLLPKNAGQLTFSLMLAIDRAWSGLHTRALRIKLLPCISADA